MSDPRLKAFLGNWIFDPQESQFDQGELPLAGSCEIGMEDDLVTFRIRWTDAEGKDDEAAVAGRPDGRDVPLSESGLVDSFRLFFDDEGALVSEARKNGEVLMSAKRALSEQHQVLEIEQTVHVPGEGPIVNSAIYRREQ